MSANRLIIGTRRYSSWSMRGALAVQAAGLQVEEQVIQLSGTPNPEIQSFSPSGLVPVLEHDGARLWDSLAIAEYCAELAPLWPADRRKRATARSLAAEMHSGFRALRLALPMNLGRTATPPRAGTSPELEHDIVRIAAIFRAAHGPFLFGEQFGAADIAFAPVVTRLLSYGLVPDGTEDYCQAVRAHPLVAAWYEAAAQEPASWQLPHYEQV